MLAENPIFSSIVVILSNLPPTCPGQAQDNWLISVGHQLILPIWALDAIKAGP